MRLVFFTATVPAGGSALGVEGVTPGQATDRMYPPNERVELIGGLEVTTPAGRRTSRIRARPRQPP